MDSNEYCSKLYQLMATINEKCLQEPVLSRYFAFFKYRLFLALPNSLKDKLIGHFFSQKNEISYEIKLTDNSVTKNE